MRICRCQRRINLVQTGRWNTKLQDTRYTSKKRSRLNTQKGNRFVQSRWNNQSWDDDYKTFINFTHNYEIDVDAVQINRRRSHNDNREKMQLTAWTAISTTMNNQKKCKYCGKQHMPKQCPAFGQTCRKCGEKNHWLAQLQCKNNWRKPDDWRLRHWSFKKRSWEEDDESRSAKWSEEDKK